MLTNKSYITKDKELHIDIDSGNNDLQIQSIKVYTNKSYGEQKYVELDPNTYGWTIGRHVEFGVYESQLNTGYQTDQRNPKFDLFSQLIIIEVEYNPTQTMVNTPCNQLQTKTAVYYKCNIYDKLLSNFNELNDPCNGLNTSKLIDGLLKKKAIDTCIESCNIDLAVQFWNKFYCRKDTVSTNITTSKCGCHG